MQLLASLTSIQSIDFTAAGVNASLTLSGAQVAQLSGGAADIMTFNINAGDTVIITDAASHYDVSTNGAVSNYVFYDDAQHTNLVAQLTLVA